MEPLYARIPAELKRRLEALAHRHGFSVAKELARLLTEQLAWDLPAQMRRDYERVELEGSRSRVEALERAIVDVVVHEDPIAAKCQFIKLHALLEKLRQQRTRERAETARIVEQRRLERESADFGEVQEAGPFDGLVGAAAKSRPPKQRSPSERRQRNLVAALQGRPRGTKKMLALALEWPTCRLSQVISSPSAQGHRKMNDDVARKIEGVLGLRPGALDEIEGSVQTLRLLDAIARIETTVAQVRRSARAH